MRSMRGFLGVLLATLLLLPLGGAGVAGAVPKMVIDRSHGQQADVSGFAGVLVSKGWEVILDQRLTEQVLSDCSLLVVTQPGTEFTANEVAVVKSYVQNGGGLWVLYDAGLQPLNALPAAFGVSFTGGLVESFHENGETFQTLTIPVPSAFQSHPLFSKPSGVLDFVYQKGTSLFSSAYPDSSDPAADLQQIFPLVVTAGDANAYDDSTWVSNPVVLVAAEVGAGHVLFMGDTSLVGDTTPPEPSAQATRQAANGSLVDNILDWLRKPEPELPEEPETITVTINLRPWNPCNKINLDSKGFIRVAVMSTDGFDASRVDPKSVVFAGASPVCSRLMNVNRDRQKDLVLVFWIPDLKDLTCDSDEAVLIGETTDGTSILGTDKVQIVPSKKCKKPPKNNNGGGKKGK
jgi:hypothetical protein